MRHRIPIFVALAVIAVLALGGLPVYQADIKTSLVEIAGTLDQVAPLQVTPTKGYAPLGVTVVVSTKNDHCSPEIVPLDAGTVCRMYFGDGERTDRLSPDTTLAFKHTYTKAGTYRVSLISEHWSMNWQVGTSTVKTIDIRVD